jgi:competence CoiA-like predicted nuclease
MMCSDFSAIKSKGYKTAWALGGKDLKRSYDSLVRGFATIANDAFHYHVYQRRPAPIVTAKEHKLSTMV